MAHDFGFDSMFFSRVDVSERKEMRKKKQRTQVWRPHEENLGKKNDILALTMDY